MENITIKDIARLSGVGVSTVSRAINGYPGINAETKARIMKVIAENHYVPNNSARNLKMLESDTVALIVKGIDNQFFQSMIKMFEEELSKRGYSFIMHFVSEDQDEAKLALELTKEKKLCGAIFLGGLLHCSESALSSLFIPYVRCTGAMHRGHEKSEFSTVTVDDYKESYAAVDYLCKKGHKRIAIISDNMSDHTLGRIRQSGYEQALKDNNIEFDKALVADMDPELVMYSIENGYITTKVLLDRGVDFTALFAISDLLAFGAYKALSEAGKRIPEDVSVMGFDGLPMGRYYTPSLTTVEQPRKKMVKEAVNLLISAIENDDASPRQIAFEAKIIERDSVKTI